MDIDTWLKTVNETKDVSVLVSLFKTFQESIELAHQVDYFDLKPILSAFNRISRIVTDDNQISIIDALRALVQHADHDIELYIHDSLLWIVSCVLDYKVAVNKAAKRCLQTYLIKTRNIDAIMKIVVEHGLQSKHV